MANDKPDTLYTLESHLGITVRDLRIQLGLTIADVAERAGISRGEIPHRPERIHSAPIWFLSIIHYDAPGTGSSEENT